jgi:hypothetical protein
MTHATLSGCSNEIVRPCRNGYTQFPNLLRLIRSRDIKTCSDRATSGSGSSHQFFFGAATDPVWRVVA